MLYETILKEYQELESRIQRLQDQIATLPEGKLICAANGKHVKWYRSDGHTSVYLPKKERTLAAQLAYKRYLSIQLTNLIKEKKALEAYLNRHDTKAYQKEQKYLTSQGIGELISTNFVSVSEELETWKNEPYKTNDRHPEHLHYKALSGIRVRSKSEMLIDMYLCQNKIPFRYECLLKLGDVSIYPDFTIRHPETGEIIYWEHFGRMDEINYARNASQKLQLYITNKIYPGINLILTSETIDNPLEPKMVEQIVKQYFLT